MFLVNLALLFSNDKSETEIYNIHFLYDFPSKDTPCVEACVKVSEGTGDRWQGADTDIGRWKPTD